MIDRISKFILLALIGISGSLQAAKFPELPAFQTPPTGEHHPGQLIWMDLFTEDTATSSAFYTSLFGWETKVLGSGRETYTLFLSGGEPVAGLIRRPSEPDATRKGTWLPYFSVANLDFALGKVQQYKGQIEVPSRDFPDRGKQAIIRDNQEALVGLMQSTWGDPDDYLANPGDWMWAQLSVRNPKAALSFYANTIGFQEVEGKPDDANVYDHLWQSGGYLRASLGQIPDSAPNVKPLWLGFVRVVDIGATVSKAEGLGGTIYLKPDPEIRNGQLAIIIDPVGAAFVVLEYDATTEEQP